MPLITRLDPRLISRFNRNLPTLSRDNASYDSFLSQTSAERARFSELLTYTVAPYHPFLRLFFTLCDRTMEITRGNHSTVACI